MDIKNLQRGQHARIKSTGQVVEVKRISDHGISLVRFKTGGEYLLLNERLEGISTEDDVEIQH